MKGIYRFAVLFVCLALLAFAAGCSKTSGKGNGQTGDGLSDQDLALGEQARWADGGTIPKAGADGPFKDIQFEFNSSSVPSEYQEKLRSDVAVLNKDSSMHAEIEGHCDKRGTTEYNMALGERRAKAVAALMASFGARAEQLSTISYGEEVPLDAADNEAAYAKNRRAHFAVYRKDGSGKSGDNRY